MSGLQEGTVFSGLNPPTKGQVWDLIGLVESAQMRAHMLPWVPTLHTACTALPGKCRTVRLLSLLHRLMTETSRDYDGMGAVRQCDLAKACLVRLCLCAGWLPMPEHMLL